MPFALPFVGAALALDVLALFALGLAGAASRTGRAWTADGTLLLSGAGLLLAALSFGGSVGLHLPVGLPGFGLDLAVDGLSGFFLLLLFMGAVAVALQARTDASTGAAVAGLPLLVGGLALTLLAADGFGLVLGVLLSALAGWSLVPAGPAGFRRLGGGVFGAACLTAALALLSAGLPDGFADLRFAAMRVAPPEGWRAGVALLLALAGAGAATGLDGLDSAPTPAAGLAGATTGVYVLIRLALDLLGTAPPLWWALPVLAAGAAMAVAGALRANFEAALNPVLAGAATAWCGLTVIGVGIALAGRALDLPPLATLALDAVLLLAASQAVFLPLLFLGADAARRGAQSTALHRLGGLVHGMPVTTACVLVGAAGLAALPPGPGFSGVWMLLQALLAAARAGGPLVQTGAALLTGLVGLAAALGAAGAVRLMGVAFLGRPRLPRTAAAEEAPRSARVAMLGLAALALFEGLFPGLVLVVAGPAIRLLGGAAGPGVLVIAPRGEAPGYSAPAIAALLGAIVLVGTAALRGRAPGRRRGPAWEGGFAAPPPWLPFGDPATQYGAASFSHILRRGVDSDVWRRWPARLGGAARQKAGAAAERIARLHAPGPRRAAGAVLASLVVLLAALVAALAWAA